MIGHYMGGIKMLQWLGLHFTSLLWSLLYLGRKIRLSLEVLSVFSGSSSFPDATGRGDLLSVSLLYV